jgi:hypothetical protein
VTSGAGGCDSSLGLGSAFSMLIFPHLSFLKTEYQNYSLQIAAEKAAGQKKTTITCSKSKLTKKVTAVKPKCPAGYKKR